MARPTSAADRIRESGWARWPKTSIACCACASSLPLVQPGVSAEALCDAFHKRSAFPYGRRSARPDCYGPVRHICNVSAEALCARFHKSFPRKRPAHAADRVVRRGLARDSAMSAVVVQFLLARAEHTEPVAFGVLHDHPVHLALADGDDRRAERIFGHPRTPFINQICLYRKGRDMLTLIQR